MGLLVAFWGFSHLGDVVLLSLVGGGFALGFVLALWPWNGYVWLGLVLAGPVAAVIAFRIINPDPGCTYDCMAKAGWALLFFSERWHGGPGFFSVTRSGRPAETHPSPSLRSERSAR
jgi:hypothetical protein